MEIVSKGFKIFTAKEGCLFSKSIKEVKGGVKYTPNKWTTSKEGCGHLVVYMTKEAVTKIEKYDEIWEILYIPADKKFVGSKDEPFYFNNLPSGMDAAVQVMPIKKL